MMTNYIEINSNGYVLRGMVHRSLKDNPIPVIFVHGYFSANKIGPNRLFVDLANRLCMNHFDVYRFDLSGMGESDGLIKNVEFKDHVSDVKNIIDYVRKQHNGTKVCVIAHCLGCDYVMENIISDDSSYREILLLAPFYTSDAVLSKFFPPESIEQLVNEKFTYRKGLYAHSSFFYENPKEEFIKRLKQCRITMNVIIPENDQFIPLDENKKTFNGMKNINLIYVDGADHNFLEHHEFLYNKIEELLLDDKYTV